MKRYLVRLRETTKLACIVRDGKDITHEGIVLDAGAVTPSMKKHPGIEVIEVEVEENEITTKEGEEHKGDTKESVGARHAVPDEGAPAAPDEAAIDAAGDAPAGGDKRGGKRNRNTDN